MNTKPYILIWITLTLLLAAPTTECSKRKAPEIETSYVMTPRKKLFSELMITALTSRRLENCETAFYSAFELPPPILLSRVQEEAKKFTDLYRSIIDPRAVIRVKDVIWGNVINGRAFQAEANKILAKPWEVLPLRELAGQVVLEHTDLEELLCYN